MEEKELQEKFGFTLKHVGLNCQNEDEANAAADFFDKTFGFKKKVGNSSIFAGTIMEAMKTPYFGKNGHIGIGADDLEKAVAYLEEHGVKMNWDSAKYKNNKLMVIYLEEEISGFAVHLVAN